MLKQYEQFSNLKTVPGMPIILRVDGRYFSKYTKQLHLKKPFDERLRDLFISVAKDVIQEFNPKYIYTFSDEFNILLEHIPFNGRVEKIDSTFASYITGSFMKHLYLNHKKFKVDLRKLNNVSFDSRIITPYNNIREYFKWRQDEAWRNCLNVYAQTALNKKYTPKQTAQKLYKLNKVDLHEILYKNGINPTHMPTWQKRGIAIYKKPRKTEGYNPKSNTKNISVKNKIYVDMEVEKL